ncbi:glutathione S-transferase family protein [Arhodomonas sp. AD133]|uniref:glutathione S-transferase family protein n=1 Tax=Arhodomonas sp. AD133 TaxID=3415009 RepID=UPI003EBC0A85
MIRVYGYPQSRSGRVVWALEEANAEYEYEPVDLMAGEGRSRQYLGVNPGGKVPAVVADGQLITESGALVLWVADRFPEAGLAPEPRTAARTQLHRWLFFLITELEQPLWTMAKHRFILPERYRVRDVLDAARYEFAIAADVLAAALGDRQYLVEDRFSVADIVAAHTLAWARAAKAPMDRDELSAYADRLLERPARARAHEREESELEARRRDEQ